MAITLASTSKGRNEFVASVPLDLMNAMYFTVLSDTHEGIDEWPRHTRAIMDPALRAELDLLFSFPGGDPGIVGALNELDVPPPRDLGHRR